MPKGIIQWLPHVLVTEVSEQVGFVCVVLHGRWFGPSEALSVLQTQIGWVPAGIVNPLAPSGKLGLHPLWLLT